MDEDESNNIPLLLLFLFIVIITIAVILYFTVFKCKSLDDKCEEDEDCCEDLKCKENICSDMDDTTISPRTTTTNTPQPTNNQVTLPESEPEQLQEIVDRLENPDVDTCGEWFNSFGEYTIAGQINKDNVCQYNSKYPLSQETIGNSIDTCCRDPTNCGDFFDLYPNSSGDIPDWVNRDIACQYNQKIPLSEDTTGNSIETCCRAPTNCGEWFDTSIDTDGTGESVCASLDTPPRKYPRSDDTAATSAEECCYDACGLWFNSFDGADGQTVCGGSGKYPNTNDTEGYSQSECCSDMLCSDWNQLSTSSCPTGKSFDVEKDGNVANSDNPSLYCCSNMKCSEWNSSGTLCTGGKVYDQNENETRTDDPGNQCCKYMECQEWNSQPDNVCPDGKIYDTQEYDTNAVEPNNDCCRYMYCRELNDINPVSCINDFQVYDIDKSNMSVENNDAGVICCSDNCQKFFNDNGDDICLNNNLISLSGDIKGSSTDECCRPPETCEELLSVDENICNFDEVYDTTKNTLPHADNDCCISKTCYDWHNPSDGEEPALCRFGRIYDSTKAGVSSGGASESGYDGRLLSPDICCKDINCQEWNSSGVSMVYGADGSAVGMGQDGRSTITSCASGTVYDPSTASTIVSGSATSSLMESPQTKCCRDNTCEDWITNNNCPSGKRPVNNLNSLSSNIADPVSVCCRDDDEYDTCLEWNNTNNCPNGKTYDTSKDSRPLDDVQIPSNICCRDVTCQEWISSNGCPANSEPNPDTSSDIGYGASCCRTTNNCGMFFDTNGDSICSDNNLISRERDTIGDSIESCCRPISTCGDYYDNGLYSCIGNYHFYEINRDNELNFGDDVGTPGGPSHQSYFNSECCGQISCQTWFDLVEAGWEEPHWDPPSVPNCRIPGMIPLDSKANRAAPAPEDRPIHEMGYVPDRCCGPPP